MTYANVTAINMGIIILAAIMYLAGFVLMLIDEKKHEKKYEKNSKRLRKIALTTAIIIQIISVILVIYKTRGI